MTVSKLIGELITKLVVCGDVDVRIGDKYDTWGEVADDVVDFTDRDNNNDKYVMLRP